MTWPNNNELEKVDLNIKGKIVPLEVLYYFDGPCVFTTYLPSKTFILAYLAEENDEILRYIFSTTSDSTINDLKSGIISVRQALSQGSLRIAYLDFALFPINIFSIKLEQCPEDALPDKDAMLLAELEPVLKV
jgi:hypothetical protein